MPENPLDEKTSPQRADACCCGASGEGRRAEGEPARARAEGDAVERCAPSDSGELLDAGDAAREVGVSDLVLSVWTERYGLASPHRDGAGEPQFTDGDIQRLRLVRQLVEDGHSLERISTKPLPQLEGLAREAAPEQDRAIPIAVLGAALRGQLAELSRALDQLDVVAEADDLPTFHRALRQARPAVLVVQLAALGPDPVDAVDALLDSSGARFCQVLYHCMPRQLEDELRARRCRLMHAPVTARELRASIVDGVHLDEYRRDGRRPRQAPARRFDDAALGRYAELPTTVECACPNHLAGIVSTLVAFEDYSKSCENDSAADEEVHAELARLTAEARAIMETALSVVLDHEGLD